MVRVLLASIAFLALYNLVFFPIVFGIGFPIFILSANIFLFVVRDKDSENSKFAPILSALSILLASFFAIKSTGGVLFVNLLTTLFLTFAAAYFYKQKTLFSGDTIQFLISPLKTFFEGLKSCFNVFSNKSLGVKTKNSKMYGPLFQGALVAVPIVVILFILLSGADPIFRTLVNKLSFSISERVVSSIIIFLLAFFWGFAKVAPEKMIDLRKWSSEKGEKFALSSLVVSGAITILFAIFLVIQLKYLFLVVPEIELVKLGINVATYSDYVRQGFFALIVASALTTGVIVFILNNLHLITTIQKKYLQIVISILSFETLLLLLSAAKRLLLYTEAHGLSHIRVFGAFFLVWLTFILILIIIMTFKKMKHSYEFASAFTITVAIIFALNVIPIDKIIATDYPPTVNNQIDTRYIAGLSPEAFGVWLSIISKLTENQEKLLLVTKPTDEDWRILYETNATVIELSQHVYVLDQKYGKRDFPVSESTKPYNLKVNNSWQAFNLSEYDAYKFIYANHKEFERLKGIHDSINALEAKWSLPAPSQSTPVVNQK